MTSTAINEKATEELSREERSALYIMLRTARETYLLIGDDEWATRASDTMELLAKDGVDV